MKRFLRTSVIQAVVSLHLDEVMLWRLRRQASRSGPLVQVVEMHETLQRDAGHLRRQLEWVAERFTLISPETFFGLWDRTRTPPNWSKPAVLFTFDDGRESNYTVAAPMLESMGTRGLFFVVPEFIGLRGNEARNFYYSKIDIRDLPLAASEEVWMPMSPQQLHDLVQRGHSVGSHTLSHVSLTGLCSAELNRQIEGSSEAIGAWIQGSVEAFAWPYAWDAISLDAWSAIRKNYRFCFSPCPGALRVASDQPHLIWRTEIEAYYSEQEYQFMYSGMVDPVWAGKRERLKARLRAQ